MPIHGNSLACFKTLNLGQRRAVVLSIYAEHKEPLTDRRLKELLEADEMNAVRPRITELIEDGYLYEVDSVRCEVTGKTVRRCSYTGLVNPNT